MPRHGRPRCPGRRGQGRACGAPGTLLALPLASLPPLHVREASSRSSLVDRGEPVLLSEAYSEDGILLEKAVGAATHVKPTWVGRDPDLGLSGSPRLFVFRGAPQRLAGSVLLWQHGALTLRLEGRRLTEARAQELAASLR